MADFGKQGINTINMSDENSVRSDDSGYYAPRLLNTKNSRRSGTCFSVFALFLELRTLSLKMQVPLDEQQVKPS